MLRPRRPLCMVVGRGEAGAKETLDFENVSKKGCFRCFEWAKTNFTTFGPPRQNLEKSLHAPLEKILPIPMSLWFIFVNIYSLLEMQNVINLNMCNAPGD